MLTRLSRQRRRRYFDDHNAPEPSVTSMAGPGNESHASPITLHAEQDRPVLVFPVSDPSPVCARWSRIPVDKCPKHPNGSAVLSSVSQGQGGRQG